MAFVLNEELGNVTNIKVIGVGGGGGNAVNRMVLSGVKGVDFIAMNTDLQVLEKSKASTRIQLGAKLTKGRGAGANPEIGKKSAEESRDEIAEALRGSQMVFITAGMGGGTGTGAAPVVAQIAKDMGILTVGIVTRPFLFEGGKKKKMAEEGIRCLLESVDSLIIVPNEKLKFFSKEKITLQNAFEIADNVLKQGVQNISELINTAAFINLDFADVFSIMHNQGNAHMGMGTGSGKTRALDAATMAITSPLLETKIDGAKGVILNIISSPDIELEEIEAAAELVTNAASPDATIIWGCAFDEKMEDTVSISIVATGFEGIKSEDTQTEFLGNRTQSQTPVQNNTQPQYAQYSQPQYTQPQYNTNNIQQTQPASQPQPVYSIPEVDTSFEDVISLLNKNRKNQY